MNASLSLADCCIDASFSS